MSPLKTQPKQYISFVFYSMNNINWRYLKPVSSQFSLESVFFLIWILQLVDFEAIGEVNREETKPWPPASRTWHVLHVTLAKHRGGMMSDLER